ncbi:unnamed protein product [Closterium sp. NIES-64]|nr:unnamed protein product [Closterium sp. NIES-64]
MARILIPASALLLLAVSLTAAPVSAHSANGLAEDVLFTSWAVTIHNITGGWKMLAEMKGSAFVATNEAWKAARDAYINSTSPDPSVKEALSTVVDTKANETALLAMSQGAWNVLYHLAHYHLAIEEVNSTFIKKNLTANTYYRLTSHKPEPIFLYYNNVTGAITVTGKKPAGVNALAIPSSGNAHTSHAEIFAVAAPTPALVPPAPAPANAYGSDAAVGKVVTADIVAEHGYAIHAVDALLFPTNMSVLFTNANKPKSGGFPCDGMGC